MDKKSLCRNIAVVVAALHVSLAAAPARSMEDNGDEDASLALADEPPLPAPAGSADSGYDRWVKDRLMIGTRSAYRILTDEDSGHRGGRYGSGTFLGTVYALDEVQNLAPLKPFISYDLTKYLGVELAYDREQADTVAASGAEDKSDGRITLDGPTLSLIGKYPNSSRFTPYLGVGVGLFAADFHETAHWALGYTDELSYNALGSPQTLHNGRNRQMEVDDISTVVLSLGTMYRILPNWQLNLSAQYFKADVDATFYGYTYGVLDTQQEGSFPMDNFSIRIGLAYQF